MRKLTGTLAAVSLACLLSVTALAGGKDLKEHVSFFKDVMVGSTMVEKGDYLIKYDAETGEMKVMDGKKVVAQARAVVKVNDKKAEHDMLYLTATPTGDKLTSVKLGGQHEEIVIADTVAVVDVFLIDQVWSDEY
ncbi:MAG TPA: hypothetical protein VFD58_27055 [Blastocatellia bacterium]|nr:hypothetical protein [Blastocatellia bacterium]